MLLHENNNKESEILNGGLEAVASPNRKPQVQRCWLHHGCPPPQTSGGSDNKPPLSSFRLDGRHVVFGSVKEGMDVVKKVESFGSRSGRTSKRITITDCGELK